MRFNEFKVLLETKSAPVYVVGDSIAVGINGKTVEGQCVGGKNSKTVLGFVKNLIANNPVKGSIVILSSGASNSTYERKSGEKLNLDMGPINEQLSVLKDAGAKVFLVGTGSAASKWITNKHGEYRVNFKDQQVNEKLAAAASANGATFLGPLEDYDSGLNSGKGDGIHPYGGYSKIYKAATGGKVGQSGMIAPSNTDAVKKPVAALTGPLSTIPSGRNDKSAIKPIQRALVALGYNIGPPGIDGIRGQYTQAAVKEFQIDYNAKVGSGDKITVDGDPGPETLAALNKFLGSQPEVIQRINQPDFDKTVPGIETKKGAHIVSKKEIAEFLKSKGLSPIHIAGLLANIAGESSFNAAALGDIKNGSYTSGGLFQHHDPKPGVGRFTNMTTAVPDWRTNWKGQINFALSEPEANGFATTKFTDVGSAVRWWVVNFEKPKYPENDIAKRTAYAHQFAKTLA